MIISFQMNLNPLDIDEWDSLIGKSCADFKLSDVASEVYNQLDDDFNPSGLLSVFQLLFLANHLKFCRCSITQAEFRLYCCWDSIKAH